MTGQMISRRGIGTHVDRTAGEPREAVLHTIQVSRIDSVNDSIRLFRLGIRDQDRFEFCPGQWLDTFVPGIPKPGGFTVTSSPSKAALSSTPYLELAIRKSPENPVAAWFWQNEAQIMGSDIQVRVGGRFVWPPPTMDLSRLRRVLLVAGGVGINPLMSMVSAMADRGFSHDVQFFYSTKAPGELSAERILFIERLAAIFGRDRVPGRLRLFLTGRDPMSAGAQIPNVIACNEIDVPFEPRRVSLKDLDAVLGTEEERLNTAAYVCGEPSMTDYFVSQLVAHEGLALPEKNVYCEKWW